jgi:hypothetical protein
LEKIFIYKNYIYRGLSGVFGVVLPGGLFLLVKKLLNPNLASVPYKSILFPNFSHLIFWPLWFWRPSIIRNFEEFSYPVSFKTNILLDPGIKS